MVIISGKCFGCKYADIKTSVACDCGGIIASFACIHKKIWDSEKTPLVKHRKKYDITLYALRCDRNLSPDWCPLAEPYKPENEK